MTRRHLASLAVALGLAVPAFAVAPPVPRVGDFVPKADPMPKAEPKPDEPAAGTPDDPEKTVKRITETAKAVGDRLKEQDTGADTQKRQDQLLRDIDSLLKTPPMPPMGGGGGGGSSSGGSSSSGGASSSSGGSSSGGGSSNSGGGSGASGSAGSRGGSQRQPRGGSGEKPEPGGSGGKDQPMPMGTGGTDKKPMGGTGDKPMPMGVGTGDKPDMNSVGGGGKDPKGNDGGKGGKALPDLPSEDPFTRQVWGHLPETLRQQASQYYREQYMPKYGDLLKQYYSTLAEKEKPAAKR